MEGSKKIMKTKAVISNSDVQKTSSTLGDHTYFQSTLMPYSIKNSVLHIPMQFAKLNGLNNRHCHMILRDQKQRSWPAELGYDRYHVYIRSGWREFYKANGLKKGDAFILELIDKGKNPVMELHRGMLPQKRSFTFFSSFSICWFFLLSTESIHLFLFWVVYGKCKMQ